MARQPDNRSRGASQKGKSASTKRSSAQGAVKGKPGNYQKQAPVQQGALLDSRTKHDIAGVVLAVLAVALFITELAFRTTDLSIREIAMNYTSEAKLAILLASVLAAIIGYTFLYAISLKRKH